jgi:hypothetical protein
MGNKDEQLSNLIDELPRSEDVVLDEDRRVICNTSSPRNLKDSHKQHVTKNNNWQNKFDFCQVSTWKDESDRKWNSKCSQIPIIINGRIETPQKFIFSRIEKESVNKKYVKKVKDHKVVIYGDSHSRGLASNLKDKLPDSFEVIGYTKPNCNIQTLLSNENQEIVKLTKKDMLVFIGGLKNVNDDAPLRELRYISQFLNRNMQTNIILLTIPYRYDVTADAYTNEKTSEINRKIRKCIRVNKNVKLLETPQERGYYTRHGLHLNGQGKETICEQLALAIDELFRPIEVMPIVLDWNKDQIVSLESEASTAKSDVINSWSMNNIKDSCKLVEPKVCRISNRKRKIPVNKTDDFLWQN